MTGITVTRSDGRLLASKPAGSSGADRRRREAHLLERLDHPGVVQFVELVEGPPTELRTVFVGTDTWAVRPPSNPTAIIEGLAAVASTVADLHDLGTAHCSLQPDHVLVAGDSRPILCGLADATAATDTACMDDLNAMASLIDHLAVGAPPEDQTRLRAVARRAEQGALTARALTTELDTLRTTTPAVARSRPIPVAAVPAAVITGAVLLAILALTMWMWRPTGETDDTTTESNQTAARPPPDSQRQTPTTAAAHPTPTTTTTTALAIADRSVIEHGGRRYAVGLADDVVILGDWNCDDTQTPAVLHPSTGAVSFFAAWPDPGASLHPAVVLTVNRGADLQVDDDQACGHLRVLHPGGSTLLNPEFP